MLPLAVLCFHVEVLAGQIFHSDKDWLISVLIGGAAAVLYSWLGDSRYPKEKDIEEQAPFPPDHPTVLIRKRWARRRRPIMRGIRIVGTASICVGLVIAAIRWLS